MKALAALLCALTVAPVQGQDLQLFLIPDTPAHVEAWQIIKDAARRAGLGVNMVALPGFSPLRIRSTYVAARRYGSTGSMP